jgi:undecaprenyl-diphosphatase
MSTHPSWITRHFAALLMLFVGVFVPLVVFGMLADDVIEKQVFSFDLPILTYVHSHASAVLDTLMAFITRAGSAWVLIPVITLVFGFLVWKDRRRDAAFWTLAVVGAALLNFLCKHIFGRERPALWVSPLPESTFSFPSGHAMASMAVATALIVLLWNTRWRALALVAAIAYVFLVGLSRIYWGVHYPSDVLAGWAASLAWVIGIKIIFGMRTFARADGAGGLAARH